MKRKTLVNQKERITAGI